MLEGKVAFITGASRGIGLAVARRFAEQGCRLYINSTNADVVGSVAATLQSEFKTSVTPLAYDVSDFSKTKDAVQTIFKDSKQLDILVNNAGIFEGSLLPMSSPEKFDQLIHVNLSATIFHMQQASRLMSRKKTGSIINMSSIIGTLGYEGQVLYSAAKAGVLGATKSAAKELAEHGIRVNAIAPGYIETDMTASLSEQEKQKTISSIGLKRAGTADDVAGVALFLASDLSKYVTGQVIGVDGGMRI